MDDFMSALEQHDFSVEVGQVVKGKPAEFSNEGVYVDIGGKSAAFLPKDEAPSTAVGNPEEWLPLGQEQEFLVVRGPNAEGQVGLSLRQLEQRRAWDDLGALVESKGAIAVKITGTNRGGVTVNAQGLRGFVPRSHLLQRDNLEALVGQRINVTPIEVSRSRKKLVLSQRQAEQATLMAKIAAGQFVSGTVSSLRPFGAFVTINGLDALLHVKQISQAHVPSVEQVFSVGETVRAIVSDVDEWKGRVALMTFPFENYKGEMLEEKDKVMAEAAARYAQLYPNKAEDADGTKDIGTEEVETKGAKASAPSVTEDTGSAEGAIADESPAEAAPDSVIDGKVSAENGKSEETTEQPAETPDAPAKKVIDLTASQPKIVALNPKPQRGTEDDGNPS